MAPREEGREAQTQFQTRSNRERKLTVPGGLGWGDTSVPAPKAVTKQGTHCSTELEALQGWSLAPPENTPEIPSRRRVQRDSLKSKAMLSIGLMFAELQEAQKESPIGTSSFV